MLKHLSQYGVFANKDSQVVLTANVLFCIYRSQSSICCGLWIRNSQDLSSYSLRGHITSQSGRWWGILYDTYGQHSIGNKQQQAEFPTQLGFLRPASNQDQIDLGIDSIQVDTLSLVEPLCSIAPTPGPTARSGSINQCLIDWNRGSVISTQGKKPASILCTINTNRNWFIFEVWRQKAGISVYCRGARISACDQGLVFAQNSRIIAAAGSLQSESYMVDDCKNVLCQDILIDQSCFHQNSCFFAGKNGLEWTTIYWSLSKYSDDVIVLNGCDGKEYSYSRPTGLETSRIETFTR
jgi:hypothetical protein